MQFETTICAPATSGRGAIGVIRVSGADALKICEKIGEISGGKEKLSDQSANTLHHGFVFDGEKLLDEVIFAVFRTPDHLQVRIMLKSPAMPHLIFKSEF
jgi:tRNA modification GTPase